MHRITLSLTGKPRLFWVLHNKALRILQGLGGRKSETWLA